jgi:hypothetical protein
MMGCSLAPDRRKHIELGHVLVALVADQINPESAEE